MKPFLSNGKRKSIKNLTFPNNSFKCVTGLQLLLIKENKKYDCFNCILQAFIVGYKVEYLAKAPPTETYTV